jgi:hypothetical protein
MRTQTAMLGFGVRLTPTYNPTTFRVFRWRMYVTFRTGDFLQAEPAHGHA